jgi:hypothetical protein
VNEIFISYSKTAQKEAMQACEKRAYAIALTNQHPSHRLQKSWKTSHGFRQLKKEIVYGRQG